MGLGLVGSTSSTRGAACACLALLSAALPSAGQPSTAPAEPFRQAPRATKTDRGHEITFALSRPADVTVRILDAHGRVIRHLACGAVGQAQAAEPLAPGSLAQKLIWDGRDDAGRPVAPGGCKVSIALGGLGKFERLVLHNPDGFGNLGTPERGQAGLYDPLLGLAVDKDRRIWLAAPKEQCIKVSHPDGRPLARISSIRTRAGELAIAADGIALAANHVSGAVYVNCRGPDKARKLLKLASWQNPQAKAEAEADLPGDARNIAADGEGGLVWVVVGGDRLLWAVDAGEAFETRWIEGMAGKTLTFPRLLTVDGQGRLYVADSSSHCIQTDVEGKTFRRYSWYGVGGQAGQPEVLRLRRPAEVRPGGRRA